MLYNFHFAEDTGTLNVLQLPRVGNACKPKMCFGMSALQDLKKPVT